ncbi:MAG: NAD(P)/FAD-dependent oxidoreductase [Thermoplasmatales archaeon]|nr:MAG: NAD(P)/FAD-dependent oxidoreductase [Thermoplasmatales archaeon]
MEKYDVAVIGGGPIGGYIAKRIAREGFKIALFEEHKRIGLPLKCAGLVTSRIFRILNFPKTKVVQNEIYGAHIYSPSGEVITIGGNKVHALVINRSQFDEEIINNAIKNGAEIYLESRTTYAKKRNNTIQLDILKKEKTNQINCSLLIGADGSKSKIREVFRFPQPTEFLKGIGAEVTNTNLNPKFVEIFLGQNIAQGLFAWIIPINKDGSEARIGLCIDSNSKNTLRQCFNRLLKVKQLQNVKITKHIGGYIPLGPLKKTVESNIMLVGDAAAQVKPTSGGGIYPGLLCAQCCSSVALEALELNDFNKQVLNKYHKSWSKEIGKELSLGMKFRTIFKNFNDKQHDRYIKKFNNKKTIDTINKYGDIDYPSKLAIPLLKNSPSLLKLLPSAFKQKKK